MYEKFGYSTCIQDRKNPKILEIRWADEGHFVLKLIVNEGTLCYTMSNKEKEVIYMTVLSDDNIYVELNSDIKLQNALDRGIDDMEAGRELPLDEAMKKITELRNVRRNDRV